MVRRNSSDVQTADGDVICVMISVPVSVPRRDTTVSCEESFCWLLEHVDMKLDSRCPANTATDDYPPTAFNSPRFPHRAKCLLKLALLLPAATPHMARRIPAPHIAPIRNPPGSAGLRQSKIMAQSLKTSADSLYILHSGSSDVPRRYAKKIVARRPVVSLRMVSSSAAVGVVDASPTPTPRMSC
jgi:hypothetical protein